MSIRKLQPGETYTPIEINEICAVTFERVFGAWFKAPGDIQARYRDTTRDVANTGVGTSPFELAVLDTLKRAEPEGESDAKESLEAPSVDDSAVDTEPASSEAIFDVAEAQSS